MKTKYCGGCLPLLAAGAIMAALCPDAAQGQPKIQSFTANGTLTYNDPNPTGTNYYAVEWAYKVDGPWMTWTEAVSNLTRLGPSGTVNVPMFYRVATPDRTYTETASYSYFRKLPPMDPLLPLETNEMRITFMGSMIPLPVRRSQAEMSVFVQVGWVPDATDRVYQGRAKDQFVFDCGAGVSANYAAAVVGFRRMDKVFINHLHGDHVNDLTHIYTFGPAGDRKSPLYVWGQKASGVESPPGSMTYYDDGTTSFCANLRKALRWHTESFSFQNTRYTNYTRPTRLSWGLPCDPVPVEGDPADDGFALVPIELDWEKTGTAYHNRDTGVKITHFPVIHCRKGSMGYKLEWKTPEGTNLTMIYTSDTKPESNSVTQAINDGKGVDVFVHEMVVPPSVWTYKNMGLDGPPDESSPLYTNYLMGVTNAQTVQNSSHTPQGAFGYLLSLISPRPKLTVATHFPVADDTVASAFRSVTNHIPDLKMGQDLIWSFDLLVLRVFPNRIEQRRAEVSAFAFNPPVQLPTNSLIIPKYNDGKSGDPFLQIDMSESIPSTNSDGTINYSSDGY